MRIGNRRRLSLADRDTTGPDGPLRKRLEDDAVFQSKGDANMRSFLMKAAIAAALVSTSLTVGYAASSGKSEATSARSSPTVSRSVTDSTINRTGSSVTDSTINRTGTYVGERVEQADPVPPVTIYPRLSMASPAFHRHARLAMIESELAQAQRRISVDRRHGELTPREVSFMRHEAGTVRSEAIEIARANGGSIPQLSYAMLQDRVSDLNRTINRYATNMARG
jgi:hypothetical protein